MAGDGDKFILRPIYDLELFGELLQLLFSLFPGGYIYRDIHDMPDFARRCPVVYDAIGV